MQRLFDKQVLFRGCGGDHPLFVEIGLHADDDRFDLRVGINRFEVGSYPRAKFGGPVSDTMAMKTPRRPPVHTHHGAEAAWET